MVGDGGGVTGVAGVAYGCHVRLGRHEGDRRGAGLVRPGPAGPVGVPARLAARRHPLGRPRCGGRAVRIPGVDRCRARARIKGRGVAGIGEAEELIHAAQFAWMPAAERRRYGLTGPPPPDWFTAMRPAPWIDEQVISEGRKLAGVSLVHVSPGRHAHVPAKTPSDVPPDVPVHVPSPRPGTWPGQRRKPAPDPLIARARTRSSASRPLPGSSATANRTASAAPAPATPSPAKASSPTAAPTGPLKPCATGTAGGSAPGTGHPADGRTSHRHHGHTAGRRCWRGGWGRLCQLAGQGRLGRRHGSRIPSPGGHRR